MLAQTGSGHCFLVFMKDEGFSVATADVLSFTAVRVKM